MISTERYGGAFLNQADLGVVDGLVHKRLLSEQLAPHEILFLMFGWKELDVEFGARVLTGLTPEQDIDKVCRLCRLKFANNKTIPKELFFLNEFFDLIPQVEEAMRVAKRVKENELTSSDLSTLLLIARGCENEEIALCFGASLQTIKNQVSTIMKRLDGSRGFDNRTEIARYALLVGMFPKSIALSLLRRRPHLAQLSLTRIEEDVLKYITQGLPNKEIASKRNVRIPTIKTEIGNILLKGGLRNRTELAFYMTALSFLQEDGEWPQDTIDTENL